MKVLILAGGQGTRLMEETVVRPKPMVEIGGMPLLWHIMMHYGQAGLNEFVVALGYKGTYIKRWFSEYAMYSSNLRIHTQKGEVERSENTLPDWQIDLVETGNKTGTGGRIKRLREYVDNKTFMLTWGDGVGDIDIHALLSFHRSHGKLATVTAVHPPARFGHIEFDGSKVTEFSEKPQTAEGWINGAFFVLEPAVFDLIEGDETMWEREPMRELATRGQLMAFRHTGFWHCMDTLRDKHLLEALWDDGAPWKTWE